MVPDKLHGLRREFFHMSWGLYYSLVCFLFLCLCVCVCVCACVLIGQLKPCQGRDGEDSVRGPTGPAREGLL